MVFFPIFHITGLKIKKMGMGGVNFGFCCSFDAVDAILFDFISDGQISSGYRSLNNSGYFLLYEY